MEQRLLTISQAAQYLAISRSFLYRLIQRGELRPVYIGRVPRIDRADLDALVDRLRGEREVDGEGNHA